MNEVSRFHRWKPRPADLAGLTAVRARDLIVRCFYEAQRETIALTKQRLDLPSDEASIRASAESSLRLALTRTGGSFEAPTRASLRRAVDDLAKASRSFGTPGEIVDHHLGIVADLLERLPG